MKFSIPKSQIAAAICVAASMAHANAAAIQQPPRTATELTASTIEAQSRTRATLTVRVATPDNTADIPTGVVSFHEGERALGSAVLDAQGTAALTTESLSAGPHQVTAIYEGDESHAASTSMAVAVREATSGVPAFTISANNTSLSIAQGSTGTVILSVNPENNFNQAVSFSCAGLPNVSTACVFSPTSVTPGLATTANPAGTAATSTLSIQTQAPSGALHSPPGQNSPNNQITYAFLFPGVFALLGLGFLSTRKASYRTTQILGITLLLAGATSLTACSQRYGYFHKKPTPNPGTTLGNYTVTITGVTGAGSTLTTASLQLAVTVTK